MSSELVAPNRLEELLAGAFPETEAEAGLQGLARQLRSASWSTPAALRRNVEALGAEPATRIRIPQWRLAAVVAGVVLVGVLAATFRPHSAGMRSSGEAAGAAGGAGGTVTLAPVGKDLSAAPPAAQDAPRHTNLGPLQGRLGAPIPAGRAQDVNMWIDLRVKDADEISSAAQQAQSITRGLGGVVLSSNVDTQGEVGRAELQLKIPVGETQDATVRLSDLGTITGQQVSTTDLQGRLDRQARRIDHMRSAIRIELARLASGQLSAAETLQAQIHLERLQSNLRDTLRARAAVAQRASMADLTLRLATPTGPAPAKSESGIGAAASKAMDFLRGAGAVVVFLALVLSPLILVAVLASVALRARNRRVEARLLDEPRPGAPSAREG
jgi:Domain of unknown function (DUF4349)